MAEGAPVHDAMEVRIPFVPDTDKADQFLADLPDKLRAALLPAADEFLARIRDGLAGMQIGAGQSAATESAPPSIVSERHGGERPLPESVPGDVAEGFRDVVREFRQLGETMGKTTANQSEEQWRREMLATVQAIDTKLEAIQGKLAGGQ